VKREEIAVPDSLSPEQRMIWLRQLVHLPEGGPVIKTPPDYSWVPDHDHE